MGKVSAIVDAAEVVTLGLDPTLGSVVGTCPFCGGTYAAGYMLQSAPDWDPSKPPGEPQATIRHTQPPCVRFNASARVFLTEANALCRDRRRAT